MHAPDRSPSNIARPRRVNAPTDLATLIELWWLIWSSVSVSPRGPTSRRDLAPLPDAKADDGINYTERLTLPVLGLGLSAGVAAGLAIPGILVGATILASATPIFQRMVQGIREEKRLTVDFLDASTIVLLTAQSSFLAPAFIVGVIEGSEVTRDWTARRSQQAEQDLLMTDGSPGSGRTPGSSGGDFSGRDRPRRHFACLSWR